MKHHDRLRTPVAHASPVVVASESDDETREPPYSRNYYSSEREGRYERRRKKGVRPEKFGPLDDRFGRISSR
jgi:hypothetical protein